MTDIFNYYAILGCHAGSTDAEIKEAHRRLSQQHHPDRGGSQDTFMGVQAAYRALKGVESRKLHGTRLSGLGQECPQCSGKGFRRKTKKFTATTLICCDRCSGSGYLPHHHDDNFGA